MNRQFILPAAIALSVHAVVLCGSKPPPPVLLPKAVVRPQILIDSFTVREDPPLPETTTADPGVRTAIPRSSIAEAVSPTRSELTVAVPCTVQPTRMDAGLNRVPADLSNGLADDTARLAGNGIASMSSLDHAPETTLQVSPEYPYALKHSGIAGEVTVEFVVDLNGRVRDVRVVKASHPEFVDPAVRAVSRWRFQPGRRQNVPIAFRMAVPILFHLGE
jgi:protein TonB